MSSLTSASSSSTASPKKGSLASRSGSASKLDLSTSVTRGSGTAMRPYVVSFAPGDKADPYNWSKGYKWYQTVLLAVTCLCPVWVSSSYVGGLEDMIVRWRKSEELGIAGLSLYLLGMALGPLLWAPMSELLGRRKPFLWSFPIFALFNLGGALAQNIETVLVVRFFAGAFGAAPLTNGGGQISDMWSIEDRIIPGGLFTLAPLLGPVLGPLISGFIGEAHGFRAVFWVQFGFACTMLLLNLLLVPETYAPALLRRRARDLRKQSERDGTCYAYIAEHDVGANQSVREVVLAGLGRPFELLFREVIVWTLSGYVSLIYGILYLMFCAFPIIFQEHRGWTLGHSGLALLGIGIGMVLGTSLNRLSLVVRARLVARLPAGAPTPPETRLPMACLGALLVPASLFWFAWTCLPPTHWAVPIVASVPFGIGYVLIFTSVMIYLIDAYALNAASALAANTVMRSVFGAAFPMFSTQMFDKLGCDWAVTLLAFLALACAPMPFLFFKYGHVLRRTSRYAPSQPADGLPLASPTSIALVDIEKGERALAGASVPELAAPPRAKLGRLDSDMTISDGLVTPLSPEHDPFVAAAMSVDGVGKPKDSYF